MVFKWRADLTRSGKSRDRRIDKGTFLNYSLNSSIVFKSENLNHTFAGAVVKRQGQTGHKAGTQSHGSRVDRQVPKDQHCSIHWVKTMSVATIGSSSSAVHVHGDQRAKTAGQPGQGRPTHSKQNREVRTDSVGTRRTQTSSDTNQHASRTEPANGSRIDKLELKLATLKTKNVGGQFDEQVDRLQSKLDTIRSRDAARTNGHKAFDVAKAAAKDLLRSVRHAHATAESSQGNASSTVQQLERRSERLQQRINNLEDNNDNGRFDKRIETLQSKHSAVQNGSGTGSSGIAAEVDASSATDDLNERLADLASKLEALTKQLNQSKNPLSSLLDLTRQFEGIGSGFSFLGGPMNLFGGSDGFANLKALNSSITTSKLLNNIIKGMETRQVRGETELFGQLTSTLYDISSQFSELTERIRSEQSSSRPYSNSSTSDEAIGIQIDLSS